ncbi:Mitochondrial import inner membrane translocase subunit Tim10 [Paramuricea clavata]|uniref:Mitochondrial import inner membrane translocase subunit n=1 Tax=Paramuricea clavata TaxID=317549 RepID=A0A7D9DSF9_PARCT|nr:Mitochondrial import inner membrane translocase subunit Tim10 [Paramuricea clavata]
MDAKSAQNMQIMADLEIEMMTDLFNKLTSACQKKCISPKYKEGELTKGESVCLDRCVAKYLEIHERIGKKLTAMSAQDEQLMTQMQSR